MPNLRGDNGPCSTASGYYLWKNYNGWELSNNNSAMCDSDKPIFKVEEAILNYAGAACELGRFDQAAADISINRLRKRAGVADMEVARLTPRSTRTVIRATTLTGPVKCLTKK
ncbi:MAG: RagB/SusD family nutrient uptake outer membrane protein [Phocaeicola vulgatus]